MPATTTRLTLPYPIASDPADVPADLLALAGALDPKTAVFVQGTTASRPAAGIPGRLHYATDTGLITYDTGSAWTAFAVSGSPPLVSSLPGSPADGQEVFYQNTAMATAGIAWHLRYRAAAAGAYKWEVVGGAPLIAAVDTSQPSSINGYQDLATPGPTLTTPLAGDYIADFRAQAAAPAGSNIIVQIGLSLGGAPPASGVDDIGVTAAVGFLVAMARQVPKPGLTAGLAVKLQYHAGTTATVSFSRRSVTLTPVRVG